MKINQLHLYLLAFISMFLFVSCKNNPSTLQQYQANYREANFVGEWVRQEKQILPKSDQYGMDKECITEDTLVFGYNNDVISKKKTTNRYASFEEEWGEYEIVKGMFRMKNDTLVISWDYPNIARTTFGKDPMSIMPHVYIEVTDSIRRYYAVKDLSGHEFKLNYYLQESNRGSSRLQDVILQYKRR